ncbi:MAG: phospholipid carrier-dependent glycosyltransferase [Thermoanaerobaculaceae bacterium]
MKPNTLTRLVAVMALLSWVGWALLRYQQVQSARPAVMTALMLAWLALLTAAAAGPGLLAWRALAGGAPVGWGAFGVALALGSVTLLLVPAALGLLGWLRPLPLMLALAGLAAWGGVSLWRVGAPKRRRPGGIAWVAAAVLAGAAMVGVLLCSVAAPFYDQLHYHLGFPFHWLRHGTVFVEPRNQFSFIAGNMSLLYCYALAGPGAWAAQATHWWMAVLAVTGVASVAHRLAGPRAGWWAAALLAASPMVVTTASWAAADMGAAAWGVASLLAVLEAAHTAPDRRWRWMLAAGILAGAAAGAKILAGATIGLPVAAVAWWVLPERRAARLKRLACWSAGAVLAATPWMVRNTVAAGHPLYPFLASSFDGPLAAGEPAPRTGQQIAAVGLSPSLLGTAASLTTFAPASDAGPVGVALLLLGGPAAWLALRRGPRLARGLVLGVALGVAAWAAGGLWGRYGLPTLMLVASLGGFGWVRLRGALSRPLRLPADLLLGWVLVWGALGIWAPVQVARLACAVGVGDHDALMRRHASYWPAVRYVNEQLPADARILMVAEARGMWLERDLVVEDPYQTPRLVELANRSPGLDALEGELRRRGITHVLVNFHEQRRIAELNGRTDYLGGLTPKGRQHLEALLATRLAPVFSDGPVEILAWR